MNNPDMTCREEHRLDDVRAANLFGLDYVEVSDNQLMLYLYFLGKAPQKIEKANLVLTGGRRILDVQITDLRVQRSKDPTLDDYLEVSVNKAGDFSTYTLSVVGTDESGNPTGQPMQGFDSAYSQVQFSFKAGCSSQLDCKPQNVCPPRQRTHPDINYLAKDYESFRQLILDRLALIIPVWNETHVPDIGITLVELLAYAGDYLSYYQDAVATEAYLGTARERISVRRHARLVDYLMHEGCDSRTWITIKTDQSEFQLDPTEIYFVTAYPSAPSNPILTSDDLVNVPASSYDVFESLSPNPGAAITIYSAHNEIHFYTWGDCQCCLAPGATSATLVDQWVPVSTPPVASPPPAGSTPGGTPAGSATGPTGIVGSTPSTTPSVPTTSASPTAGTAAAPVRSSGTSSAAGDVPTDGATSDGPPGTVRALQLNVGDVLILEEVLGPNTGNPADADPTHRQAVRLTNVTPAVDPLYHPYGTDFGQPVVEIEWDTADALTFPLCLSSQAPPPACNCMENVTVVRGNVILVDNGGKTGEQLGTVPTKSALPKCPGCCEPSQIEVMPGLFRPALTQQPLTFSEPLPPPCSAEDLLVQDPRQALPQISLVSIPPGPVVTPSVPSSSLVNGAAPPAGTSAASPPPCAEPLFAFSDLTDPTSVAGRLLHPSDPSSQSLLSQLSSSTQQLLASWDGTIPLPVPLRTGLIADLTALLQAWSPMLDLLESGPDDRVFVVEVDNNGYGHLRFGDGSLGYLPDAGTAFRANYRIGNGTSGNVGRKTITYIVFPPKKTPSGVVLAPRNPLPAMGGTDPEPIEDVKLFAPYAFRDQPERAITAADYGSIAEDNSRRLSVRSSLESSVPGICGTPFVQLQTAKAALRWTGSWYTMLVALDPAETEDADQELLDEITAYLAPFRRMGYDLLVAPAEYVPLTVSLTVCVLPNYLRGHVESAVLDALSNRVLPNGSLGFFHPDNLSFGDGIYASQLIATVQAVTGVQNVKLTELERFEISEPTSDPEASTEEVPSNWVLSLGPLQIARLDNDPNFPENGVLTLDLRGGR